jgi:hypothetical protein
MKTAPFSVVSPSQTRALMSKKLEKCLMSCTLQFAA